jgi:tRNA pseudouridine55 synthase
VRAGGRPPDRAAPAQIHRVALETWTPPDATLRISCAGGTYIRSLAGALGRAAGCGAHLLALQRLRIGPFRIEDAAPAGDLDRMTAGALRDAVRDLAGVPRATNH